MQDAKYAKTLKILSTFISVAAAALSLASDVITRKNNTIEMEETVRKEVEKALMSK